MQRKIFVLLVCFLTLQYSLLRAEDKAASLDTQNQPSPQGSSLEEVTVPDWIKLNEKDITRLKQMVDYEWFKDNK